MMLFNLTQEQRRKLVILKDYGSALKALVEKQKENNQLVSERLEYLLARYEAYIQLVEYLERYQSDKLKSILNEFANPANNDQKTVETLVTQFLQKMTKGNGYIPLKESLGKSIRFSHKATAFSLIFMALGILALTIYLLAVYVSFPFILLLGSFLPLLAVAYLSDKTYIYRNEALSNNKVTGKNFHEDDGLEIHSTAKPTYLYALDYPGDDPLKKGIYDDTFTEYREILDNKNEPINQSSNFFNCIKNTLLCATNNTPTTQNSPP